MKTSAFALVLFATMSNVQARPLNEFLETDGRFQILREAVTQTGLADTMSSLKNATFFAPTDAAFRELKVSQYESLFNPEDGDKGRLKNLLLNHIIEVPRTMEELAKGGQYVSKAGYNLKGIGILKNAVELVSVKMATDCDGAGFSRYEEVAAPYIAERDISLDNGVIVQVLDVREAIAAPQILGNICLL